jgi:hypothetical protein
MGKSKAFPTHSSIENHNTTQPGSKGLKEGVDGCSTPKIKLIFNLPGRCNGLAQRKWANANPFEVLNGEDKAFDFLKKALKALEGGWTFQGKKKHKVKTEPTHPTTGHPAHLNVLPGKTLGKRKVKNIRNSTIPFLTH